MRNWYTGSAVMTLLAASLLASTPASAATLEGTVIATESRWSRGHTIIVTERVVEAAYGSRITVQQVGGSTEGIAMRRSHSLPVLARGDQVVGTAEVASLANGGRAMQLTSVAHLRRASTTAKNGASMEFVRTQNKAGAQIFWASGCALVHVDEAGSSDISGDQEFVVIDEVLGHWEATTRGCSEFSLVNEGTTTSEVGFDGTNVIKFREDQWCRPATEDDPQDCYDQAAAGITTLFFVDDADSSRNGEILDADIELNSVNFAFAVDGSSAGSAQCQADLANTLTHEVGHFLGLDHTCWVGGERLEDDEGRTVPSCGSPTIDADLTEATMYNFQSCGETKKASLEQGDVDGFCGIYPQGEHPSSCEPANIASAGCCTVAAGGNGHSGRGALALLGFAGVVVSLRRRTKNRS